MPSNFTNYPQRPQSRICDYSFLILKTTHESASNLLNTFNNIRIQRRAHGTPTNAEQDLLRAMLVFASAGLDSVVKQLVKDTIKKVVEVNKGAESTFKAFVEKKLYKNEIIDHKLITGVFFATSPREHLLSLLKADLLSSSLQSKDALFRAGSFFNIPSNDICTNPDKLSKVFHDRNHIVHEMDIDLGQTNRNRLPRRKAEMIGHTNYIFEVTNNFLKAVDRILDV